MFSDTLRYVLKATEQSGRAKFGSTWQSLNWVSMLAFNAIIIQMAEEVKPNIRSYFKGAMPLSEEGMSRNRVLRIYESLRTYDLEDAKRKGMTKRENVETYDSLWKCRDVWNKTMVNFQKM